MWGNHTQNDVKMKLTCCHKDDSVVGTIDYKGCKVSV